MTMKVLQEPFMRQVAKMLQRLNIARFICAWALRRGVHSESVALRALLQKRYQNEMGG